MEYGYSRDLYSLKECVYSFLPFPLINHINNSEKTEWDSVFSENNDSLTNLIFFDFVVQIGLSYS